MASTNLLIAHEYSPAGTQLPLAAVLDGLPWNEDGLIAAIAQQYDSGEVLMLAWMNRTALEETLASGRVCYWSRSRRQLWRKGETSGAVQRLIEARFDCDGDALLLRVAQSGGACHTGRASCFYNRIEGPQVSILDSAPHPAHGA
ncbi:phosphoribosyl-AMP cyclohydrolase [Uliginosibacterium sediminicola]|uniref:Phosphoribosyl-AMP cyclohydrolase n=1 Tax=Uliginosibacterium sediminicola TaxID=2024550 RepID=A0ABU9YUJ0_9RHOO